jgi:hypothetical protein
MSSRHVALVGAASAIAGWLIASTVSPPVARVQTRPPVRNTPAPVVDDMTPTPHVRLDARPSLATPEGRRNPFVFAARAPHEEERRALADATARPEPTSVPAPAGPAFVLSGIGISGDTRTAVLTATGADVLLVKINDTIDGYTVTEISESSITLTREGETFVLRFKN